MEDNRQNIPSFIGKLSLMLQDSSSSPYVSWGASGESIIVTDTSAFATAVLPRSAYCPPLAPQMQRRWHGLLRSSPRALRRRPSARTCAARVACCKHEEVKEWGHAGRNDNA
jgi:hypothetical protein